MADNQYSRRHASRIEDLPENDPLAELARIVGYDSEPAPSGPKSDIDLENELLRELGVFDEPATSERSRSPAEYASVAERPSVVPPDDPQPAGDEQRFADGSVEISLEDELLHDIEDGYRADNTADVPAESDLAPAVAEDFRTTEAGDAVESAEEGDLYTEQSVEGVPEPTELLESTGEFDGTPVWEEESAEEFDALARHEVADEPSAETAEAALDPKVSPVDVSEEPAFNHGADETVERWDEAPEPATDMGEDRAFTDENPLGEMPAEAFAAEQSESIEPLEPVSADENSEDNDLPFIALSHPEEEPEQHTDIEPIGISETESELAAGFDSEIVPEQAASEGEYQQPESVGGEEEFHPHNLFDPAPEAWQEVDTAPQDKPAAPDSVEFAADSVSETEVASAELSEAALHQGGEVPLAPPPGYAHSAEDILAEIERFDLVKRDEEPVLTAPQEPGGPEQPTEATAEHEDAAPDLDDWLREMTLDQSGERDEAPSNEAKGLGAAGIEPEYDNSEDLESGHQDNVVRLHPASPEPVEPVSVDEPVSDVVEDDFISDDMIDLDAALEADLAAVHEEILAEAEIDQVGEPNEVVATDVDEGGRDAFETEPQPEHEDQAEPEGFFFPPVEPSSQAPYEEQGAAEHPASVDADYLSSPTNLEAVASLDANTSNDHEFDAASLAEFDELVEPMADLGIPDVSREAEEPPAAPVDDEFDLDMEAELAELLDNGHAEPESAAESVEGEHTADMAAAAVAGSAAAAAGLGYSQRQQEAAVEPSHVSFDYDDMERGLDAGIADELTESAPAANPFDDERPSVLPVAANSTTFFNRRRMMLAGGVAGLVVLAGVGVLAWNYNSADGQAGSGPPIIAADTKPAKEKPADPGGKTVPNQNKVVYDSVDGTTSQQPEQQKLVTTAERPVDVVQRTLDPDVLPLDQQRANTPTADGTAPQSMEAQKGQDRLPAENGSAGAPQDAAPRGVEPHRVQTMIVTADGKLVPREESQPAPAANAAGSGNASSNAAAASAQVQPQPMSPAAPAATATAPHPSPRPTDISATAPAPTSPAPAAASPATAAPAAGEPAAETAKAAPAEQTQPVDNPGGYFIQISSQPSEAAANTSYKNLSARYSAVIGDRGVDIQRAEIDGKGVYYRVRIPAGTREEAISLCENYKSAGGSCYVTR